MNRRVLLRDFIIANLAGMLGSGVLFAGIILQAAGKLPKYPCAFLTITHMYCPGCGGSRALLAILKLNVLKSLLYNPAVVVGAVLLIYYEAGAIITLIRNDGRYHFYTKPWPVYVYIVFVIVYFIIRNILYAGFGIDLISIAGSF